jgi:hypothetical protein
MAYHRTRKMQTVGQDIAGDREITGDESVVPDAPSTEENVEAG